MEFCVFLCKFPAIKKPNSPELGFFIDFEAPEAGLEPATL